MTENTRLEKECRATGIPLHVAYSVKIAVTLGNTYLGVSYKCIKFYKFKHPHYVPAVLNYRYLSRKGKTHIHTKPYNGIAVITCSQ